jgi:O-antigen/teichoic acid export membrane protein
MMGGVMARLRALLPTDAIARRVSGGAAHSFLIGVGGMALSFLTQIGMARLLGTDEFGYYAYALSWVNWLILLGRLEFDTAAIRFVGSYAGTDDVARTRGYVRFSRRTVLVASIATSLGALLVTEIVARFRSMPPGQLLALRLVWCVLPLTAQLLLHGNILQGFKRVYQSQVPNTVLRPALLGGSLLLAYLAGIRRLSAGAALVLNVLATLVALAVAAFFVTRHLRTLRRDPPVEDRAVWWTAVKSLMVISLSQFVLSQQADVVVVGSLLSSREAGFYTSANQLAWFVGFGGSTLLFMTLPMIAEMHAKGDRDGLQKLVRFAVRAGLVLSVPVLLFVVLFGRWLLRLYGAEFVTAYPVLVILSVLTVMFSSIGGLAGFLLTMTGHERDAARIAAFSSLVNIILTLWLTVTFGMAGTAVATALAGVLRVALLGASARRHLQISIFGRGAGGNPRHGEDDAGP